MKILMFCFAFIVMAINAYSQEIKPNLQMTSEEYLQKSKNQSVTAGIMFGVGTAAMVGGLVVSAGSKDDFFEELNAGLIGTSLLLLGLTLDVISIPIFISADKNRKRAMEAVSTIKFEDVPSWSGGAISQSNVPTLSIQVRF